MGAPVRISCAIPLSKALILSVVPPRLRYAKCVGGLEGASLSQTFMEAFFRRREREFDKKKKNGVG